jgi:putative ABC transport system permease protein
VVAHLRYIQNNWGITPYQIWMKAKDSTDFIYDFAAESGVKFTTFRDSRAQLIELKNDPIFQGTNGILTLCFVVVLLLCAVGFLIYWILSIRSRTLLMGIFRAMGMTLGEIVGMLANEQVFISGVSIALGVAVGLIASKLYVPLVQLAYASTDTVLPLKIISDSGDMARLLCLVAAMVILCMVILGVLVKKIKISQALKLGED